MPVNLQQIVFDLRSRVIVLEQSVAAIGKLMKDATEDLIDKKEDNK